jgi:hypothetical protein
MGSPLRVLDEKFLGIVEDNNQSPGSVGSPVALSVFHRLKTPFGDGETVDPNERLACAARTG